MEYCLIFLLYIYLLGVSHCAVGLYFLHLINRNENKEVYYSLLESSILVFSSWIGVVKILIDLIESKNNDNSFKALLESVDEMIWIYNTKEGMSYFSPQWERYTGIDHKTLLKKGVNEFIHEDDFHRVLKNWEIAQSEKKPFEMNIRYKNKKGEFNVHLVKTAPIFNNKNQIIKWIGVSTNIHNDREIILKNNENEKKIMFDESRYLKTADAIELGIWYASSDLKTNVWSDQMRKHFWIDAYTVIDENVIRSRIHEDDYESTFASFVQSFKEGIPFDILLRTVSPLTKEVKSLRVIGWYHEDVNLHLQSLDGIALDVTKNVKMYELSKEQQWRYEMALMATNKLIWDWDFKAHTITWSEVLHTHYGWPKDLRITNDKWYQDKIHIDHRDMVAKSLEDAFKKGKQYWKASYKFMKFDGTFLDVIDHGYIVYDDKGVPVRMVGSYRDMTENQNHLLKLEQAVKVRDEFLSIASHELKTPLTSMILQLQLLKKNLDAGTFDVEKIKKGVDVNLRQSKVLANLIEQMLDVSRIKNGKMQLNLEHVTMAQVVQSSIDSYSINVKNRGLDLDVEIRDESIINGDSFKLEQVVYNLVSNALKYGNNSPIHITVYKENEYSVLSVKDQGIGIPKEIIQNLFNLFERGVAPKNIAGLGLGLYICKEIVHMHGGKIEVESKVNEGSNFKIYIPIEK